MTWDWLSFGGGILVAAFAVVCAVFVLWWQTERPVKRCEEDGHLKILSVPIKDTTQIALRCAHCHAEDIYEQSDGRYDRSLWGQGERRQAVRERENEKKKLLREVFHGEKRDTLDEWRRRHIG